MAAERHLWSAVLDLAIEDLRDSRTGAGVRYRTRLWFASETYEAGSFLWICDQLDLDASAIRRRVIGEPETETPAAATFLIEITSR